MSVVVVHPPPTSPMVIVGTGRRLFLLVVAFALICGCAVLTLGLGAVPKVELVVVGAAVIYVQAVHFLLHPTRKPIASSLSPPSSSSSSLSSSQPRPSSATKPLSPPSQQALEKRREQGKDVRPLAMRNSFGRITVRIFILVSFVLSLIVPWAWLVALDATPEQTQLLGPPLFLMMVQVLFEIWGYRQSVNLLVRIGIPVGFVAYRLRLLLDWVRAAYDTYAAASDVRENKAMLALAGANLVFWCIILFYVLLLRVCPPYFKPQPGRARGSGGR